MAGWRCVLWISLILAATSGRAEAVVTVAFRPGFEPAPEQRRALSRAVCERLGAAQEFLRQNTDYRLDTDSETLHVVLGHVRDQDGSIIPACYTFPDSVLRIAPDYVTPLDDSTATRILQDFVRLAESPAEIEARCQPAERDQIAAVVSSFIDSELVHELYHDWQNRRRRFPAVDRGKTILNLYRGSVGADWKRFLETHGVDIDEHDRQFADAELECCRVQALYWASVYGSSPRHPLAQAFQGVMQAATRYYRARREL